MNLNFFSLVIKNGFKTLVFKITGLLLSYLMILFVTNNFGAAIYGKFSIAIIFSQIIALVFTLGFPSFIVTLLTNTLHFEQKHKTNFFKKVLLLVSSVGIIISLVIYCFSNSIANYIFNDVSFVPFLKVLSFLVLPIMLHEIFLGYLKGMQSFTRHNLFLFILPPVFFFLVYFLLQKVCETDVLVFVAYTIGIFCIVVLEIILTDRKYAAKLKDIPTSFLLKRSLPMMYSGALIYVIGWTDVLMLKIFKSSVEVGIYNATFKVASLGLLVITSINIVITPKISELFIKKDLESLHKLIFQTTWLTTLLSLPLLVGLIIFNKEILRLFGPEFIAGSTALVCIVSGIFINVFSGVVDQLLNMTNNQNILKRIVIFSLLLNVILNCILIPKYGINGAAFASLATNIILNVTCVFFIKKKLGFFTFLRGT